MLYRLLEACCPHSRTVGQVSTPRRDSAPGRRVGLKQTRGHSSVLLTTAPHTQSSPAGFLSSALKSSAGRLAKLSSSNGFHAGCAAAFPAPPDAPALLRSCPASPTSRSAGWAALGSDGRGLRGRKRRFNSTDFSGWCERGRLLLLEAAVPVSFLQLLGAVVHFAGCRIAPLVLMAFGCLWRRRRRSLSKRGVQATRCAAPLQLTISASLWLASAEGGWG